MVFECSKIEDFRQVKAIIYAQLFVAFTITQRYINKHSERVYRGKQNIKMISGIHLQPELKKAFEEMGFLEMTDIQVKTIPLIQQGKDVIGQSQTGSGKTIAFWFPILEKVNHNNGLQALILVPTRELCEQVTTEMRKFSKHKRMSIIAVYGGDSINPQIDNLRYADIVVGTPGRTLDHLQRGTINLRKVKILVLDEADKMFEMGFIEDVKKIISQVPRERQTLLFSAT